MSAAIDLRAALSAACRAALKTHAAAGLARGSAAARLLKAAEDLCRTATAVLEAEAQPRKPALACRWEPGVFACGSDGSGSDREDHGWADGAVAGLRSWRRRQTRGGGVSEDQGLTLFLGIPDVAHVCLAMETGTMRAESGEIGDEMGSGSRGGREGASGVCLLAPDAGLLAEVEAQVDPARDLEVQGTLVEDVFGGRWYKSWTPEEDALTRALARRGACWTHIGCAFNFEVKSDK
ncbi:unnamed protein product, partial [Prorocentrum cordatum]